MQIGNKTFKPGLIPTIVFLLVLPVLLRLGFWQLDRAEEKRQLIELFKQQNEAGPLHINGNIELTEAQNYRNATVEGNFDKSKQIFIDNKIHQGNTGVYVVTPFKIKNSDYHLLVNRGWVAMNIDRKSLPQVKTDANITRLSGKLKIVSKNFTVGGKYQSNEGWPALVQWINFKDIEEKSGLKILPYMFLLDEKEKGRYIREWKPVVMQPEKSISYAVQWFSLALALVIIYIVVNLKAVGSESGNGK